MEEKKEEIILLEELITSATEYTEKLSTFNTEEERAKFVGEMNEMGNRFVVRTYIPMMEKMKLLMDIVFKMQSSDIETAEVRTIAMEKDLFFNVLLGAYAGVDVSNIDLQTYASYDLLYPFYAKFILQFCAEDYSKFEDMLNKTINFYNIREFMDLGDKLDFQSAMVAAEANKKIMDDLNKERELIKELKEIFATTHPSNQALVDELRRIANDDIRKEEEKE